MIRDSKSFSSQLPSYPRTPHLPYKPNMAEGDVLADNSVLETIRTSQTQEITEKVDGANCAIMLDEHFIIRNRDHILKKGYVKKETPAKLQFRPLWNWAEENKDKFEALNKSYGNPLGVYGEWLWALHGIEYDALPSYFVAFELYDTQQRIFIQPAVARKFLQFAKFTVAPILHTGPVADLNYLEELCNGSSAWSSSQREGIYIKDSQGTGSVQTRYKMIRPEYVQGALWSHDHITKQKLKA